MVQAFAELRYGVVVHTRENSVKYGHNFNQTPYVKNKAGLTGQTVPGRRIPGHWPTPVPEALAVAEPVTLVKG